MNIIVDIIIFFTGLALGNWLAIGRDKRKEFNEVADKVNLALKKQKESIKNNSAVVSGPEDEDLEIFKRRISSFKQRGFEKSLKEYIEIRSSSNWKQDDYGQPFYKEPQKVIDAIDGLLSFTNRK